METYLDIILPNFIHVTWSQMILQIFRVWIRCIGNTYVLYSSGAKTSWEESKQTLCLVHWWHYAWPFMHFCFNLLSYFIIAVLEHHVSFQCRIFFSFFWYSLDIKRKQDSLAKNVTQRHYCKIQVPRKFFSFPKCHDLTVHLTHNHWFKTND